MSYTKIKGLSDVRRLPRLGKIRLGIRVRRGLTPQCQHKEDGACFRCSHPKEVPYFVLPPEARAIYGNEPTEIDIIFPVDDLGVIFPQAYKWYGSDQGLKCKGDGETALRRLADVADPGLKLKLEQAGQQPDDLVEIPCPCPLLESGKCGPKGCLMVMLPRVSCGGVYQIDTGSVMNLAELNSTIEFVRSLLGQIAMVPLKLRRVPQEVQHTDPKTGKATKKVHYLLKLVFEGSMEKVLALRGDRLALVGGYEVAPPVESGPDPLGERPAEINGDVIDVETGEVLSPTPHDAAAKPPEDHQEAHPVPLELEARLKSLSIDQMGFLSYLASVGALKEGQRFGDLPLSTIKKLLLPGALEKRIAAYREWLESRATVVTPDIDPGSLPREEGDKEKMAKAERLAPLVVSVDVGAWEVPATKEGAPMHRVILDDGGWGCDCMGYGYRMQDPAYECSHIWAARLAAAQKKLEKIEK